MSANELMAYVAMWVIGALMGGIVVGFFGCRRVLAARQVTDGANKLADFWKTEAERLGSEMLKVRRWGGFPRP